MSISSIKLSQNDSKNEKKKVNLILSWHIYGFFTHIEQNVTNEHGKMDEYFFKWTRYVHYGMAIQFFYPNEIRLKNFDSKSHLKQFYWLCFFIKMRSSAVRLRKKMRINIFFCPFVFLRHFFAVFWNCKRTYLEAFCTTG